MSNVLIYIGKFIFLLLVLGWPIVAYRQYIHSSHFNLGRVYKSMLCKDEKNLSGFSHLCTALTYTLFLADGLQKRLNFLDHYAAHMVNFLHIVTFLWAVADYFHRVESAVIEQVGDTAFVFVGQ